MSLNNQQNANGSMKLNFPGQIELRRMVSSPIRGSGMYEDACSREYLAFVSASVFNQLQGMTSNVADQDIDTEQEIDKTMRYVEPFTQRASVTNLELAEPMEIGQ